MEPTIQNIINNWVDTHVDQIVARLSLHMRDAATIEQEPYNALLHRGLLMLYVHEGVNKIVDVQPESLLEAILIREQEVMDRVNAACDDAEDTIHEMEDLNETVSENERLRRLAEEERAARELLRIAEENSRNLAENSRQSQEQNRQTKEDERQAAEQSRSSWFDVFRNTVETWFSKPSDGSGIKERWEAFKSSSELWDSVKRSAWDTFFGATADSEGSVRKLWSTFFSTVQSLWAQQSQDAAAATQAAQDAAAEAEAQGNAAEAKGETAEAKGYAAKNQGDIAENQGDIAEAQGNTAEVQGNIAEQKGLAAYNQATEAAAAELQRQTAFATLIQNMQALYQQMLSVNNHPVVYGADGYIYRWDVTTEQYIKTNHFWQKLDRFHITKEFASIALMRSYDPEDLPQGEDPLEKFDFVLIKSTVDDPDNSKLYSYMGEDTENDPNFERWHFLGDFSGAMGFTGKTPQFSIGTVTAGAPGSQPNVSITPNGTDGNGNPCFLINFAIPQGAPGRGIEDLSQIEQSSESEGQNIWEMTLSDGTKHRFCVLNGHRGLKGDAFTYQDLTQAQKLEIAGIASGFRFHFDEDTGNLDITCYGSATAEITNETLCLNLNIPQAVQGDSGEQNGGEGEEDNNNEPLINEEDD